MSRMRRVAPGFAVGSMLTWRRLPGSVAEHARRRSAARSLARPALHARVPESKWLARKDSNLRSPDPESGARFGAREPTGERGGQRSLSDSGMSHAHIPGLVRRISQTPDESSAIWLRPDESRIAVRA